MKTTLPLSITTVEDAKNFLSSLIANGEIFHLDDSAHDIIGSDGKPLFTWEESERINHLLAEMFCIKDMISGEFCHYGFIMDTMNGFINCEKRVYVLEACQMEVSGYDIDEWAIYEEKHGKLHPDANAFIEECERVGQVFSLSGFMTAYNLDEAISQNSYIFITSNY